MRFARLHWTKFVVVALAVFGGIRRLHQHIATSAGIRCICGGRSIFIRVKPNPNVKEIEGSGFLVSETGFVVTARHLLDAWVEGKEEIRVSLRSKHSAAVPARVFACEQGEIDLCLIKIAESDIRASGITSEARLACRGVRVGEKIRAVGYPFGRDNPISRPAGEVTGTNGAAFNHLTDVALTPGMSGGPVLDEAGAVIGSVAGAARGHEQLGFFTPILYGKALLIKAGITCAQVEKPVAEPDVKSQQPDVTVGQCGVVAGGDASGIVINCNNTTQRPQDILICVVLYFF